MSTAEFDPVLDMFNTTLPEIPTVSVTEAKNSSNTVSEGSVDHGDILPNPASVSRTAIQSNKRPAGDLTDCAEQAGRRVRLKTANVKELLRVAKNKIELYTFTVIASPTLSSYVTDGYLRQLVMGVLERHPNWGYTKEVREDPLKKKIVLNKVMTRLTDRRSKIKAVIVDSLGAEYPLDPTKNRQPQDILELCQEIAALAGGSLEDDKFKVTLQMGFKAILDRDLDHYGQAPVGNYYGIETSPSQQVSEGAARGQVVMEDEV
ncbi:hypothetical protein EW026_g6332 [Hermanssonia centrifuga]|uniref:Uncharacterized protein n=1 Tax=Hermanssonia centrifuga TaxID=98765 RepID=A0A4S4KBA3_9APHY|nr:hypothetical protein EW026_g6332 [Hermanssonia centrifuga]